MFKKKPSIKPHAPLRSSDRRKIAQRIIKDLSYAPPPPNPSEEALGEVAVRNLLLPDGSSAAKFATTHGPDLAPVNGTIYLGMHLGDGAERPLWVRIDRSQPELFPTVYTLWKNPTLLPVLLTHSPVIERLCDGADLMIPGLIGPPFPGGCTAGSLVGIASSDRPTVAVAVGVCEVDVSGLQKAVGEKGRAVRVLHWVGDEIYKHGGNPQKVPEEIEVPRFVAKVEEIVESVKEMAVGEEKPTEGQDTVEEEFRELETPEVDDALYNAMLYGLQDFSTGTKNSSLEFPMSSSVFIATLVHPYLPPASYFPPHNLLQNQGPHPSLQLKKSSWKSAAKFLKTLEKKGLAKTKTRGGGETVIMELNWGHDDVVQFVSYKLPSTAPKEAPSSGNVEEKKGSMVKVEALFRPNGKGIKFFEEFNLGTKEFYTAAHLKTLLNNYIDANVLAIPTNKRLVKLDPILANALFTSPPTEVTHKRDVLSEKLVSSCSPYYRITLPSGEEQKPKSGQVPKVSVVTEKRQGKKTVTRMFGLEPFGIDPKGLAEELQRICAGSATVGQGVGLKPGLLEVMVQGSQSKVVEKALEKRGVAGKLVYVLDKSSGKKG